MSSGSEAAIVVHTCLRWLLIWVLYDVCDTESRIKGEEVEVSEVNIDSGEIMTSIVPSWNVNL